MVGLMSILATDGVRPQERFDYWRDARTRTLSDVTITIKREDRLQFHGRIFAATIGDAVLAEMDASSYQVSRSKSDIDRVATDTLMIGHQVRGPGWLDAGDRVHAISEGMISVLHSDVPFLAVPRTSRDFHFRTLKIPLAGRESLAVRARGLVAEPLAPAAQLTRLIHASFEALFDRTPDLSEASDLVQDLAQLTLLARDRAAPGAPESRTAIRSGYLRAAQQMIRRALHRPDLSAKLVADAFAISERQIHLLFEPTGCSFARTLMALRLAKARELLASMPDKPIADVAYGCGFDSIATFYRAFRLAYGMAPGEFRLSCSHA